MSVQGYISNSWYYWLINYSNIFKHIPPSFFNFFHLKFLKNIFLYWADIAYNYLCYWLFNILQFTQNCDEPRTKNLPCGKCVFVSLFKTFNHLKIYKQVVELCPKTYQVKCQIKQGNGHVIVWSSIYVHVHKTPFLFPPSFWPDLWTGN